MLDIIGAIPFPDWINDTAIPLPGPLSIKWYGLGYIVGISLAYLYALRVSRTPRVWTPSATPSGEMTVPNKAILEDFFFWAMMGIMVGGRLGYVLLYKPAEYLSDPLSIFKIWDGGMAFHGGALGVGLAALYLARKYKISLGRIADMSALGAAIGIGLVRLTNFANQELYGRATEVPWAFIFDTDHTAQPRHPSQLYEAFLEGLVIWVVIRIATHKFNALTRPGLISGLFMLQYGIYRMMVETVREPDNIAQLGVVTRGMIYSLPLVIAGLLIVINTLRKPPVAPLYISASQDDNDAA